MNDTLVLGEGLTRDEYHRQVASELRYLPDAERNEILAEVNEHLAEVSSEGGDLVERLGTPQAYAEELVTAAGLTIGRNRDRAWWRTASNRIGDHRYIRSIGEFLPTLRPGWWVLRGFLALVALAVLMNGEPGLTWWGPLVPLPLLGGFDYPVSMVLLLGAIALSVAVGRRVAGKMARAVVVMVNVAILALSGLALLAASDSISEPSSGYRYVPTSGLRHNGDPIRNIAVFDVNGKPLSEVRLYDQDGNPITVNNPDIPSRLIVEPRDRFGVEYPNAFPLVVVDRDGDFAEPWRQRLVTIPPLVDPKGETSKRANSPTDG